jgi:integrase
MMAALSNRGVRPWTIKIRFSRHLQNASLGTKGSLQAPSHPFGQSTSGRKLQADGRTRDLAMFNLAIDSKLRACDVVALKVEDIAPNGYAADRATVLQRKTGQPVRFELTEQTRRAVDEYLRAARKAGDFMFSGRKRSDRSMTTRQYARLVSEWIASIGLDRMSSVPIRFVGLRRR